MVFKHVILNTNHSGMDNFSEFIKQIKSNQKSFRERLTRIEDLGVNVSKSVLRDLIQDARELHEGSVVLSYILFNDDSKQKSEQLEISHTESKVQQQLLQEEFTKTSREEEVLIDALDEAIKSTQIEIESKSMGYKTKEDVESVNHKHEEAIQNTSVNSVEEKTPIKDEVSSEKEAISVKKELNSVEVFKGDAASPLTERNTWNSDAPEEDNSLAAQLAKKRIESLISAIGINEKFLFTNELFDGNTEQFLQVIEDLNNCTSLKEAKSKLVVLAGKRNWEQAEDPFQKLQTLVSRKHQ